MEGQGLMAESGAGHFVPKITCNECKPHVEFCHLRYSFLVVPFIVQIHPTSTEDNVSIQCLMLLHDAAQIWLLIPSDALITLLMHHYSSRHAGVAVVILCLFQPFLH